MVEPALFEWDVFEMAAPIQIPAFYAYCGNKAIDLDPLPVSRPRLTVVEPALFEWDVFEMAAQVQSPAKCEVRSVIRFLRAKGERPAEIHKQIVAVFGNVMISTCFFT